MKTFQIVESWHNRCDNAAEDIFCESTSKENLEEILKTLCDGLKANGLGWDFPSGTPTMEKTSDGATVLFLGADLSSSEYWRAFRIVEAKTLWGFQYDEEYPDTAGRNFVGVLTNEENYLFWHAFADNDGQVENCHIYSSLKDLYESQNEVCVYPWTAENDSLVLEALNTLHNPLDYCGEGCPLSTLEFNNETE